MATGRGSKTSKTGRKDDDVDFLLQRIEEQNEQITRLQTKFRDVTHAYKSLLAEKQALEITIKALKTKNNNLTPTSASGNQQARSTNVTPSSSHSDLSEAAAGGEEDRLKKVEQDASSEEKIAALTTNIQIVLENKARLEMNYQAEKKKLRADIDDLKSKFDVFRQEAQKTNESNEQKIRELKSQLKQSHSDRENLTVELNSVIKLKQAEQENKILSVHEENQSLVANYRNENNDLKMRIKNLTKQFENKCEELVQTENEYKKLKISHEEQLKMDEIELTSLRNQLKEQTRANEKRVGDLEAKIGQLCSTIANYETSDDTIKSKFTKQTHSKSTSPFNSRTIENEMAELNLKSSDKMDFDSAVEQISQLKSYIESTARELNINFNFNEIWLQSGEFNSKLEKEKQKEVERENDKLKEENRHLKEEYEKFKIRTNYLLKSAKQLNKDQAQDAAPETHHLHQQINKLKDEIESLKKRLHLLRQEKDEEIKRQSEERDREVTELRHELKQQFERMENERDKLAADLEFELKKQRERTMKLLAEKEAEIEQLTHQQRIKSAMILKSKTGNDDSSVESNTSSLVDSGADNLNTTGQILESMAAEAAAELGSNYMLYYNQQLAYKDNELNKLRLAKSDLEYKIKQLMDEHSVDIDRMQAQIGLLKDEIERCKLNDARNDLNRENLEYIKNVVFNYMTTRDQNVKMSMANAIVKILKFSKSEKTKLNQLLSTSNMN